MYQVLKILNNNTILAKEGNNEIIILAKGIGFGKKVNDHFEIPPQAKKYMMQKNYQAKDKLKKVIDYINIQLKDATEVDEARNILMGNIEEVNNIAINVLWENGFDYEAKTMISRENFPDKVYGDYLFPQGNYEAFRIIIGNGEGHNWWCVMFPPLCFVDETKGDVDSSNLKEVLVDDNDEENNNIKCKFKIVELIKDILKNN